MLLLNIESSPPGAKAGSIAVTNVFLDAYQALHSDAKIDTLNVWEENLPDFDQEAIGAKYKGVNTNRWIRPKPTSGTKSRSWRYAFNKRVALYSARPCGTSLTLTSSSN